MYPLNSRFVPRHLHFCLDRSLGSRFVTTQGTPFVTTQGRGVLTPHQHHIPDEYHIPDLPSTPPIHHLSSRREYPSHSSGPVVILFIVPEAELLLNDETPEFFLPRMPGEFVSFIPNPDPSINPNM